MRHLDDEDLDLFSVLLEERILRKLDHMEHRIMSTLAEVLAADAQLTDEVNQAIQLIQTDTQLIRDLQGTIGSGNLPPEAQAQVDQIFTDLGTNRDNLVAALSGANSPPPVFVTKIDGESFTEYQVRLVHFNGSVPIADQAPSLSEDEWNALPVG